MPQKWGQHFLTNPSILEQLARAACGDHTARVIEIGPGRGALTGHLLPLTDELHAIEIDPRLADLVQRRFGYETKLFVHAADVLETDLAQWGEAIVVGNLPYYITSPIVERFLNLDARFQTAVFLTQKEVADRLMAQSGTRAFGYLSVATQLVCRVELVCAVPAKAFSPPPKVESAAVRLVRKPVVPDCLQDLLVFVGRCFTHKRKTLRNNLRPYYGAQADDLPEAGLRAEELPLEQFSALHERLRSSTAVDAFTQL